jgi:hypothetical protein
VPGVDVDDRGAVGAARVIAVTPGPRDSSAGAGDHGQRGERQGDEPPRNVTLAAGVPLPMRHRTFRRGRRVTSAGANGERTRVDHRLSHLAGGDPKGRAARTKREMRARGIRLGKRRQIEVAAA